MDCTPQQGEKGLAAQDQLGVPRPALSRYSVIVPRLATTRQARTLEISEDAQILAA